MTSVTPRQPLTSLTDERIPDARVAVLPDGIVATGFPAAEATCRQIGITFDPWQVDLNRAILGKDRHGLYAADTVAMSICRQAGKTFDVGALVFADSIINPGTTTVWTAHRFKVSRESFNELRAWARSPLLAPHIDYDDITTGAGNETIPFRNGSRIVFAARERGAIRGFTKVRRLILDEAQILTAAAMSDLAPTMNQATNPQIILMGTPPKPTDPGEVFTEFRRAALAGESEGLLYVEFAADPGAPVNVGAPGFWAQMEKANPSYPSRTDKRAIVRLRKLLTDDGDFRREAQGIWDAASRVAVFGAGKWEAVPKDDSSPAEAGLDMGSLGLAVSIDLERAAIVGAAEVGDSDLVRVLQHGPDPESWLVARAAELHERHGVPVVIDGRGPGADYVPALREALGDALHVATTSEVLDACAGIYKTVRAGMLTHSLAPGEEQDVLDRAVADAVKRDVGDRWAWGRRKSGDISPLEAATLAVWGLSNCEPPTESAYEDRGVLTI